MTPLYISPVSRTLLYINHLTLYSLSLYPPALTSFSSVTLSILSFPSLPSLFPLSTFSLPSLCPRLLPLPVTYNNAFLIGPIKSILQKMSTCCKLQLLGRLLLHKLTLQLGEWQSVIDDRCKLAHDLLYMLLTCRCCRCHCRCSSEIGSKLIIRLV